MKKILKYLFILSASCFLLSGCAGNTGQDVSSSNSAAGETGQNQKTGREDVTLSIWADKEDQEYIAAVTQNFIKKYESEANIKIEYSPMPERECRSNLLRDVLNGPDVYTTTDGDIQSLAAGGAASPVTSPEEISSRNTKASVDAVTVYSTVYGYPVTADNGYFLYYNKEYLSSRDIQSLDKILHVAARNRKKFAMDWTSGWYIYSFFGQTGMRIGLTKDGMANLCNWNNTKGEIKGTDVASSLLKIARNPGFENTKDWIKGMQRGKVIACVSGIWDETAIKNALGGNYAAAKLPSYTVAGKQVQMASFFGYKMLGVNPYSEHIEWAHKLADYISNEDNQKLRFEMRGQCPSNTNASKSDEITKSQAASAVLAQSEYSELQRIGGNYWEPAAEFGTMMASGNTGGQPLQKVLDNMVKKIKASTLS